MGSKKKRSMEQVVETDVGSSSEKEEDAPTLNIINADVTNTMDEEDIKLCHIQQLICHVLDDTMTSNIRRLPKTLRQSLSGDPNKFLIEPFDRVVVVLFDQIHGAQELPEPEQEQLLRPMVPFELEFKTENENLHRSLFYIRQTKEDLAQVAKKRKKERKKGKKHKQLASTSEHYLLLPDEVDDLYAAVTSQRTFAKERWTQTQMLPQGTSVAPGQSILAMDCEMCVTELGSECTRVTVVDENHQVVYDSFVLPERPVLDYKTQYSGITKEMLDSCTTTHEMVQAKLMSLISSEVILAGHSIENDLQSLAIRHERIIDTSVLYPHPQGGYKQSLRRLAQVFLKEKIQNNSLGHCSAEDATATMKLVQLKIRRGPTFPVQLMKDESLFIKLDQLQKRCVFIDSSVYCRLFCGGTASAIASHAHQDIVKKTRASIAQKTKVPNFIFSRFSGTSDLQDTRSSMIHHVLVDELLPLLREQSGTSILIGLSRSNLNLKTGKGWILPIVN